MPFKPIHTEYQNHTIQYTILLPPWKSLRKINQYCISHLILIQSATHLEGKLFRLYTLSVSGQLGNLEDFEDWLKTYRYLS